eukprot:4877997-Pyramimonas_sp.AAC.1
MGLPRGAGRRMQKRTSRYWELLGGYVRGGHKGDLPGGYHWSCAPGWKGVGKEGFDPVSERGCCASGRRIMAARCLKIANEAPA